MDDCDNSTLNETTPPNSVIESELSKPCSEGDISMSGDECPSAKDMTNNFDTCENTEDIRSNLSVNKSEIQFGLEDFIQVPKTVTFPLELNRYLKVKLLGVVEENWQLTQHVHLQSVEVEQLRRLRDDCKVAMAAVKKESPTILSTKVIELSKKNRDMTAQIAALKFKIQKLMSENDELNQRISSVDSNTSPSIHGPSGDEMSALNTSRTDCTDVSIVSHQLTKTTTKMMEYRRMNQQLQMELRLALKALSQEVGDGTTPKTVLQEITASESTWRGRQQQILTLQHKVAELQFRVSQQRGMTSNYATMSNMDISQDRNLDNMLGMKEDFGGGGDGPRSNIPVLINPSTKKMLQQCENKRYQQMEKMSEELTAVRDSLKTSQLENSGSKARIKFLEGRTRSLRVELDEAEIKLRKKNEVFQQFENENKELRHEILVLREREKRHREATSAELHEANQALARERTVVVRLQNILTEKQEHLQRLDYRVSRLQDTAETHVETPPITLELKEKLKMVESQLQLATQSIHNAEKERERLLTLISNSVDEAQQERKNHNEASKRLTKAFTIMGLSDNCINRCLDVGQVTNIAILQEVEDIRTLVRELKVGSSQCWDDDVIKHIVSKSANSSTYGIDSKTENHKIESVDIGRTNSLMSCPSAIRNSKTRGLKVSRGH